MNNFKKSLIELLTFITIVNLAGCSMNNSKPEVNTNETNIEETINVEKIASKNDNNEEIKEKDYTIPIVVNTITEDRINVPVAEDHIGLCEHCKREQPSCDIEYYQHGHLYSDYNNGLVSIDECKKLYEKIKTEDIYIMNDIVNYDLKFIDYLNENELVYIPNNYVLLDDFYQKEPNYILYEYEKEVTEPVGVYKECEFVYEDTTYIKKLWTTDPYTEGLTGRSMEVEYAYQGYKVVEFENKHDFYLEVSPYYSTLDELIEAGYEYIRFDTFLNEVNTDYVMKSNKTLTRTR